MARIENMLNKDELEEQMIYSYTYKPLFCFLITFFATYALWFAGAYVSFQEDINHLYMLLMLPGLMAPFFISVLMIWTSKDSELKMDFVKGSYQYEIFHQNIWFGVNFFVSIIPMGVIISWICIKNRKSVTAAILFHFIINISQEILEITQTTKCIQTVVLAITVVLIVTMEKEMFFSKGYFSSRISNFKATEPLPPRRARVL